jgi:hypothetical protein
MKIKLRTAFFLLIIPVVAALAQPGINPATGLPADGSTMPKIDPATGLPDKTAALEQSLDRAKNEMAQGEYDDALTNLLWYFNQGQYDEFQKVNRLSSGLAAWVELGRRYPKAKQALVQKRDDDTREFQNGRGDFDLFMELNAINQHLQDDDATVAVFKSIGNHDPELAGQCYGIISSVLVQKGDYQTCLKYMGDHESCFQGACRRYQMEMESNASSAKFREQQMQRQQEFRRKNPNIPVFTLPDNSKMSDAITKNLFVNDVRQLIEVLVATGDKADAVKIQHEAIGVLDDPRLEMAVADADEKVIREVNGNDASPTALPPKQY